MCIYIYIYYIYIHKYVYIYIYSMYVLCMFSLHGIVGYLVQYVALVCLYMYELVQTSLRSSLRSLVCTCMVLSSCRMNMRRVTHV